MVGCWVRLKIACLLMRWLLELVVLMFRADRAKDKVTPEPRAPDSYEWIYVFSGHMRLVLGDKDWVLGPGEVVELDTDVPHWFGSTGNEPA